MTSLYFVTLRISWDLYRNMLGLTFILLSLPLLEDWKGPRKQVLLSALIVLAVASDQLTGVISLALLGARALMDLRKTRWLELARALKVALPGLALFLSIVYAGIFVPGHGLLREQPPVPSLDGFGSSVGFLAFAYGLLIPLILLGVVGVRSINLRGWSIFCVVAALSALLPFFGLIVDSYRWSLLLDIPLCVYAAAGLSRLVRADYSAIGWLGWLQRHAIPLFGTMIVLSTALYIALPAQQAVIYYTAFPALLPTSMVQDTVPLSDMGSLKQLLDSTAARMGPGTVLITHQAVYGWARAYLPSLDDRIINYQYYGPLQGVEMARSEGYSTMLMIWWANGLGWHNQPDVPSGFGILLQDGNLALYKYY